MSKVNNNLFLSLSIIAVLVIGGIGYYTEVYSSSDSEQALAGSEEPLLSPAECLDLDRDGVKDKICRNEQGEPNDCCSASEKCKIIYDSAGGSVGSCVDKDNQCKPDETLCEKQNAGAICCPEGTTCGNDGNIIAPFCVPIACEAQGESACRDEEGKIVCCALEGESECDGENTYSAECIPEGGRCPTGKSMCLGAKGNICCDKKTELCLVLGGKGNTPICIPKPQPESKPGSGGSSNK